MASIVTGLLMLLLTVLAGAAPASAHDRLVSTTPASGEEVRTSPEAVTLTFNEPVRDKYSEVQVTGPEGGTWQVGDLTQVGSTLTQELAPLGPAGVYTVDWRVVSGDGHPVAGTFTFTLTVAGDGTPQTGPGTDPVARGSVRWLAVAGVLGIVAVALVIGALALSRRGRGRGARRDEPAAR